MNLTYKENGKTLLNKNFALVMWTIILLIFISIFSTSPSINNKYDLVYNTLLTQDKTEVWIVIKDGTSKEDIDRIVKKVFKEYKTKNIFIRIFDDSYYIGQQNNYIVDNMALGHAESRDREEEIHSVEKNWSLKPSQEEFKLIISIRQLAIEDFADIEDDKVNKAICDRLNISEEYLKVLLKKDSVWSRDGSN